MREEQFQRQSPEQTAHCSRRSFSSCPVNMCETCPCFTVCVFYSAASIVQLSGPVEASRLSNQSVRQWLMRGTNIKLQSCNYFLTKFCRTSRLNALSAFFLVASSFLKPTIRTLEWKVLYVSSSPAHPRPLPLHLRRCLGRFSRLCLPLFHFGFLLHCFVFPSHPRDHVASFEHALLVLPWTVRILILTRPNT